MDDEIALGLIAPLFTSDLNYFIIYYSDLTVDGCVYVYTQCRRRIRSDYLTAGNGVAHLYGRLGRSAYLSVKRNTNLLDLYLLLGNRSGNVVFIEPET